MEYYNTLRLKGVPTRFVYFPDENHCVAAAKRAAGRAEFFAWIDRYVGHGTDVPREEFSNEDKNARREDRNVNRITPFFGLHFGCAPR